ncbi:S-layer homology domain-containing protein [Domibacillus sp. DTU_2020_1001157_1_SI_ALB_TIR_016]|uniref:S-layer homology domain-containing protein n=1 Tax=Domibacillus sp. DTU_2020_1001157_1_SI_ALB_TIR_016 TaxID=3077789 RepID=UPI0028E54C81|nr:S-layer homology domain-containing protein [Domibacillus sp. DTU_2020_1001157_1_SI_ALB_TIR_016]WNS81162.1 S-layer homology domain-containing protein [Domibacillus sp. DTU_2020_1001157_1_SI_ALB_TIR_016]
MGYKNHSYRKFVASAATATVVASAVTPAFAALPFTDVSGRYTEAVEYLVDNQITNGISKTQFGTNLTIKRVDAAVMIAKALELDTTNAPNAGFTDLPDRAVPYVNALKAAGIVNGKTATTFGSNQDITRGELAIILSRAYDLKGDVDNLKFTDVSDRYDEAVAALVDNGLTTGKTATSFGTNDPVKRGEMAIFLYRTPIDIEEPAVKSVKPQNAKQITVTFNTELNKDTLAASLFTLNNTAASKAVLSEDGKTVLLTFDGGAEVKDGVLVVNPIAIKADTAIKTAKYTSVFTYEDTVKPFVTGTSYSNGVITLTFSEELSEAPAVIRVDGTPVAAGDVKLNTSDKTKVEITKTLDAGDSASLYVAGAADASAAKHEMDLYNGSVSAPTTDTNKPHVTGVEVTGQNTAKVTVSEAITQGTVKATLQQGADQTAVTLVKDTTDASGKTYNLTVAGDLFSEDSTSETFTLYIAKDAMSDLSGLKNDLFQAALTFVKDAQAPVLASSKVTEGNKALSFTFDEAVTMSGSLSAIDIRNADGVKFTAKGGTLSEDKKTYTVKITDADAAIAAGTYTVSFPSSYFADAYGNKTAAIKDTFTIGETTSTDTVKPEASVTTAGTNTFKVTFNEEVTSSALTLSNYRLDGTALPAGTDIYFTDSTKKAVMIELPEGAINIGDQSTGAPAVLNVAAAADKAGNVMTAANFVVTVKDNTPAVVMDVKTVGTAVVVTFSEAVKVEGATAESAIDANDVFDIKVGSTTAEAGTVTVVSGNEKQVQFNLASSPASAPTVAIKDAQTALKDANGVTVK